MNLEELISDKKKYNDLEYYIRYMIECLNNAILKLEVPSTQMSKYYTIDGESIDSKKLTEVRNALINKRNYLKNVVLVSLTTDISNMSNQIGGLGPRG